MQFYLTLSTKPWENYFGLPVHEISYDEYSGIVLGYCIISDKEQRIPSKQNQNMNSVQNLDKIPDSGLVKKINSK